jgi:hypothetical protein
MKNEKVIVKSWTSTTEERERERDEADDEQMELSSK